MPGMIANALVPIFFGLSLGYFAGWRGIVDNKNVTGLNTFLLSYALPAALFLATAQTPRQMLAYHAKLFGILALSMILTFVAVLLIELKVFKFSPADSAAIHTRINKGTYSGDCGILCVEGWPCVLDGCGCGRIPRNAYSS